MVLPINININHKISSNHDARPQNNNGSGLPIRPPVAHGSIVSTIILRAFVIVALSTSTVGTSLPPRPITITTGSPTSSRIAVPGVPEQERLFRQTARRHRILQRRRRTIVDAPEGVVVLVFVSGGGCPTL